MTDPKFDNVKTPLFAAVGAGDAVVQAVADVVAQVRSRAESTTTDVTDRVDTARARLADLQGDVSGSVESLRGRLERLPSELPDEIAELRERFTPDELKKVAEAYLKVASDIYSSLAERGEETVERILKNPTVEEGLERANAAANDAVDVAEDALGRVASQTRAVGERAAALAGIASDKVKEGAEEISEKADELSGQIDEAGDKIEADSKDASQKINGLAGTVEAKTRGSNASPIKRAPTKKATPAKKAAPAKSTAPAKPAAPAKKAPAKKST